MQYISQLLNRNVDTTPRRDLQGNIIPTTVLITGGSGGIGLSFAKLFAKDGYNLVLVARNFQSLEKAAAELSALGAPRVETIQLDLGTPDAASSLLHELCRRRITIDILVNNAGHGRMESFLDQTIESVERMVHLNMTSLTLLNRMFIPGMIERGFGKVLNIASVVAYVTGPYQAVYNASKAYVLSLSNALSIELKNTPVTVTAVCPGFTRTDFFARAGANAETVFSFPGLSSSPDEVAAQGYEALFRGDMQYTPGFKNWVMASLFNVTPAPVAGRISGLITKKISK